MPRFTFVIPVFKSERTLPRCIRSLKEQSLKDCEFIFALDGPSVEARNIIAEQLEGQARDYKVVEIEHGGANKARNAGAKEAKGEFLVFWDSDCYIEPEAARNWIEVFESHPDIDFIYSGYRFENDMGAIQSESFDPWLLKVRNYICTMSPMRRAIFPGFDESLKSLQDWDLFLTISEHGHKGLKLEGYSFSTEYPDMNGISGQGAGENWLERVKAVKSKHGLTDKPVCVASLQHKADGINLAKLIDADFQMDPSYKPHEYKTLIQVGFSCHHSFVETHARIFNAKGVKKVLFWTADNVSELWNSVNLNALDKYSMLLNNVCEHQYCEDQAARNMLKRAGFNAEIMPLPMTAPDTLPPLPDKPRFLVDIAGDYGHIMVCLEKSLPEVEFVNLTDAARIADFTGALHFYQDRTMSSSIKRALLAGRHVISNVQAPFAGYINDMVSPEKFLDAMVDKVRSTYGKPLNVRGSEYYSKAAGATALLDLISEGVAA